MPHDTGDIGGAKDLALYRLSVAKEELQAAETNFVAKYVPCGQ